MIPMHWRGPAVATFAMALQGCGGESPLAPGQKTDTAAVAAAAGSVRAQNAVPSLMVTTRPVADNSTNPPRVSGSAPLTVSFSLCNSGDSDAGDSLNWQFHFGDSGQKPFNEDGSGFNHDAEQRCRVEHTYAAEGTYTAWVSVTDKHLEDQSRGVSALARRSQALTIVVGAGGGSGSAPAAAKCGSASSSIESSIVPLAIAENATVESPLAVSSDCPISSVTASLYLTHPVAAALRLSLVGPDGTTVPLAVQRGGAGDDFGTRCDARTVFDDNSPIRIGSSTAPFSGTFFPETPLSAFGGRSPSGTWRLRVENLPGGGAGTLNCWGVRINN